MQDKELKSWKSKLLDERERIVQDLGSLEEATASTPKDSSGDLSSYSSHMADQGTDAMEREKAFLMASEEGRFLWHLNQALRRLYTTPEKYGKCENCGEDISVERLDALPHARLCINCKEKEENGKHR